MWRAGGIRANPSEVELDPARWDRPLAEVPLAFVDLETTGCDPDADRICEVAIERRVGGRFVERLDSLVRAGVGVGRSFEVHGITDESLRDAPSLAELAPRIDALLDGAIIVGHAVDFDLDFLQAASADGHVLAPPRPALDTKRLAQRALRTGSTSLAALASDLGLPVPTHRAGTDVTTTVALFVVLVETLRPGTPRHLAQAQDLGAPARWRDDVGEVLESAYRAQRTVRVRYRVPGRDAFEDELAIWALEPPRVEGWLFERGQLRALRGDRILRAELGERAYEVPAGFCPTIPRTLTG